jgi:hypothetical protein
MKKLLSAIAGAGIVAMATLASAPAQAQLVGDTVPPGDYEVSQELEQLVNELPGLLEILDAQGLLDNPDELNQMYNSIYAGSNSGFNPNAWVISKDGCSVDVGCSISKIGVVTALQCYAAAGLDPEAVASCLQEKDQAKYLAAASCTYGNCPAFAALPGQLVATSTCQYEENGTLAGNLLLNTAATFEANAAKPLQVDLLFKG